MPTTRSVLVTGASGYIGSAVCRAFVRAGWRTYGLVRRPEAALPLVAEEVIPIVKTLDDPNAIVEELHKSSKTFNVMVNCSEPHLSEYVPHFHQMVALLRQVAEGSVSNGVRPLVLWSSGCKDYGVTDVDGAPGLAPHTEKSPLHPASLLANRTNCSMKLLDEYTDLFDGTVLRPTNVYGYSSSYYGGMFEYAAAAAAADEKTLRLHGVNPKSIMHAMHIDDCAEAYVALAEHPDRSAVGGQCFNISAHKYETAEINLQALANEYGFPGGAEFVDGDGEEDEKKAEYMKLLFGWSQWVDSEKIRHLTGWTDKRMLFSENIGVHRAAYDVVAARGDENVARIQGRASGYAPKLRVERGKPS